MLYKEIVGYIDAKSVHSKKIAKGILDKEVNTTKDIVDLYCYIASLLKDLGVRKLPEIKVETKEFNKKDMNNIILTKGILMNNQLIALKAYKDCAAYIDSYLSKFLLDNPKVELFSEFQKGNFSGLRYVFNENFLGESFIIRYKKDGEYVGYTHREEFRKLNKEEVLEIFENIDIPDEVSTKLKILEGLNKFPVWKKLVIEAAETTYRGDDINKNGGYLSDLDEAIKEKTTKTKEKKNKD